MWAHLNPECNYAYDKNGLARDKNFKDVFITLYTTKWDKDPTYSKINAATTNGWLRNAAGGHVIRIRENGMYLVTPVVLTADYAFSGTAGTVYYKEDGYQVNTAKAGDTVYAETKVERRPGRLPWLPTAATARGSPTCSRRAWTPTATRSSTSSVPPTRCPTS